MEPTGPHSHQNGTDISMVFHKRRSNSNCSWTSRCLKFYMPEDFKNSMHLNIVILDTDPNISRYDGRFLDISICSKNLDFLFIANLGTMHIAIPQRQKSLYFRLKTTTPSITPFCFSTNLIWEFFSIRCSFQCMGGMEIHSILPFQELKKLDPVFLERGLIVIILLLDSFGVDLDNGAHTFGPLHTRNYDKEIFFWDRVLDLLQPIFFDLVVRHHPLQQGHLIDTSGQEPNSPSDHENISYQKPSLHKNTSSPWMLWSL